ncbi:MAG TPA: sigma 54-interacting transcriptional regulator [Longimicrobium sp.]|nr:sigma 54-interacting transcriptional regulator [Longimicrobium sp.]
MSVLGMPTPAEETELARRIRLLALEQWGERRCTTLVGRHPSLVSTLEKVMHFAQAEGPVLITGESGTGKELFAHAVYLLSNRRRKPYIAVNCAQYGDGHLIASELFGHRRGSFTGAFTDHRGVFEEADGGVVMLDEVGELSPQAQAMLLRALSEGEIVPVGETRARSVNVRVIAATNRDLRQMVAEGKFREDLFYRLRFLHLTVPPLRQREDDWQLLMSFYMRRLGERGGVAKRCSPAALERLARYPWPGNVRELRGLAEVGYCLAGSGALIEPEHFEERLETPVSLVTVTAGGTVAPAESGSRLAMELLAQVNGGSGNFWSVVYEPFMERDLNRGQVQAVIEEGLRRSNWSYKRALRVFGVAANDYLRFMDFLRHHQLKPQR